MKRQIRKTQAIEPQEPFLVVAQRLGDALADTIRHPNCPSSVANAISELDTDIFNRCNDLEISLRHSFPHRLAATLEMHQRKTP